MTSVSSAVRSALYNGLAASLDALTPPAVATPVDPGEQAQPTKGCAWVVRGRRAFDVGPLQGRPIALTQHITYTIDFQAYYEATRAQDAALNAATRVDEMVDAFISWLQLNPDLTGTCLFALPVGTSDEPELEERPSGWTAAQQLHVRVELRL